MSFITQVSSAITRIGTEFKSVYAKIGDLTSLTTASKSSVVSAINELVDSIGGAGASINDTTASTTAVYSSQHVTDLIAAAKSQIIDGAPAALDTLSELATALGDDPNAVATLTTAVGNRVRFDAAQSLTSTQKTQAIANMGVIAASDIGDVTTDLVAVFTAALA